MSNSLAKIDSKLIGEVDDEVFDEAALELDLLGADLPGEQSNLQRVKVRARYGRFVATQGVGHLVARGEYYQGALEELMENLRGIVNRKDVPADILLGVAEAMKNISNASANRDAVQLKAYEILAVRGKKKGRQANAPQAITGTVYQAENMQIVGNQPPQPKPVEDADVAA